MGVTMGGVATTVLNHNKVLAVLNHNKVLDSIKKKKISLDYSYFCPQLTI